MSQKFQASVSHKRGISFVKLSGIVDEDNRLGDLVEQLGAGTVVIDLAEVDRINSCGVRDWVNWLGRIEAKPAKVVLVECSPSIVAQINLVSNFTGGGAIKSFYAPYFCAECDQEKVLLVDVADLGPGPIEPPTCRCDDCDLVMDFDDMPDSYFAFLANPARVKLVDGGQLDEAIREFGTGDLGERSRVRPRAATASISGTPAPASVPSLQSIARVSTAPPMRVALPSVMQLAPVVVPAPAPAPPMPPMPPMAGIEASTIMPPRAPAPITQPPKLSTTHATPRATGPSSKLLLVVLITALVVSVVLLAYLLLT